MPTIFQPINLTEEFYKQDLNKVVIINDLPNHTEQDRKNFDFLIKEIFSSDMIAVMPRCNPACGETQGQHMVGEVCPKCNTEVRQAIETDIRPIIWFRKPKGIVSLLAPDFLIMLKHRFSKRGYDIIQWFMDRSYAIQGTKPEIIHRLTVHGFNRGYNYFIENIDHIVGWLMEQPEFKSNRNQDKQYRDMILPGVPTTEETLSVYMRDYRSCIFTDYLPLPNRALLVVEKTPYRNYMESHVLDFFNTMNTMLSIDRDHYDQKLTSIENRTARILTMFSQSMEDYVETNIQIKEGLARKHLYGGRANFAFRAVITSHEELADFDEIHIPWGVAMTVWELHIMAYLMNKDYVHGGMSLNQATEFHLGHIGKYSPILDAIMTDMLESTPGKCFYSLMQRNPSLLPGSALLCRITRIKKNPEDASVSISDLLCSSMNA